MNTSFRKRLLEETADAYVDGRVECAAVSDAYMRWLSGPSTDAEPAFLAYRAALDREERASRVYAGLIRRVGELVATVQEPDQGRAAPLGDVR